jgi:hypothetical protein
MISFGPVVIMGILLASIFPTRAGIELKSTVKNHLPNGCIVFVGQSEKRCGYFVWPDSIKKLAIYQVDRTTKEVSLAEKRVFWAFVLQFFLAGLVSAIGAILVWRRHWIPKFSGTGS